MCKVEHPSTHTDIQENGLIPGYAHTVSKKTFKTDNPGLRYQAKGGGLVCPKTKYVSIHTKNS